MAAAPGRTVELLGIWRLILSSAPLTWQTGDKTPVVLSSPPPPQGDGGGSSQGSVSGTEWAGPRCLAGSLRGPGWASLEGLGLLPLPEEMALRVTLTPADPSQLSTTSLVSSFQRPHSLRPCASRTWAGPGPRALLPALHE